MQQFPTVNNLHSAVTEKLQKYADLKAQLITIWQLQAACVMPLVLSTDGIIRNKLHDRLKLLTLRPALYILMQKAVQLNACRIIREFMAEE
jgi:hypothetical protein